MIARLRGAPAGLIEGALVLEVGGVGYLLHATHSALRLASGAEEVVLETYLHVREDTLALYGFSSADEREVFEHLLSVSGIGPKVALAIVSGSSPGELRRAVALEDVGRFQVIPGIGKKTAQRVVLELKEKLASATDVREAGPETEDEPHAIARAALVELGYSVADADRILAEIDPDLPAEERVRIALKRAA